MYTVSLLKVDSYENRLKEKINDAINLSGGFKNPVKTGDRILLKPNFITARSPESAVTTHPEFIAAVAELFLEYGCSVAIGDSPGLGSAVSIARKLGLIDRLKRYNVEFINFQREMMAEIAKEELPKRKFKRLYLAGELKEYDHIINLPKLKSHAQMGITLATKNLFGCVVGKAKGQWHFAAGKDLKAFARLIVEIAYTVNASLHILDGIDGMDGNGPTNGRKRHFGVLLAGRDPVALDRVVAELIGRKPEEFPLFGAAREAGLGVVEMSQINIKGAKVSDCKIEDFIIPSLRPASFVVNETISRFIEKVLNQKLVVDHEKCINCLLCKEQCPAGAISHDNGRISLDHSSCIRCCCCQEICPAGALTVSEPFLLKLLSRIGIL